MRVRGARAYPLQTPSGRPAGAPATRLQEGADGDVKLQALEGQRVHVGVHDLFGGRVCGFGVRGG